MKVLTFQNITLTPVKTDSQIWLSSADLANALGYSRADSVTRLYRENADEFRSDTTQIIKTNVKGFGNGNSEKEIRIFSLRGCHLIAMFARTAVAKQFRQWVLDILDKEVGQPTIQKTTVDERIPLKNAVNLLVAKGSLNYSECYKLVHQYMGVNHIDEIPLDDLPKAVEYVHSLIVKTEKHQNPIPNQNAHNAFWRTVGILEYFRHDKELRQLQNAVITAKHLLDNISTSLEYIANNKGLIYDALDQQQVKNMSDTKDRAIAFINRQKLIKTN